MRLHGPSKLWLPGIFTVPLKGQTPYPETERTKEHFLVSEYGPRCAVPDHTGDFLLPRVLAQKWSFWWRNEDCFQSTFRFSTGLHWWWAVSASKIGTPYRLISIKDWAKIHPLKPVGHLFVCVCVCAFGWGLVSTAFPLNQTQKPQLKTSFHAIWVFLFSWSGLRLFK